MNSLTRRMGALERVVEAKKPVLPSVVLLVGMDGTACVDGNTYPTTEEAKAAHPSPSGLYVEALTFDGRVPQEVSNDAA
ncbi:MAG: hypothetical protein Q8O35_12995 [Humidesulfovibrio sp.]|uniref:hypothetical protein n=1 Tax=Humidesulfovibrio sp. TaxID=2910988 RepID=UPI00273424D6|nr:hypothetical protein [Humidesulfovibrio sp.]MDP2849089.1 hypothetical protein [Humidesulfovibrio sp.]